MRSPGAETWHRRKKSEDGQVRGWRAGGESRGRTQARHCSLISPEAGSMLRAGAREGLGLAGLQWH